MRAVTKRVWAISRLRETLAGELGDPALAGGQRVEPREDDSARARAGGAELGLGIFGERSGAGAVGGVERLAEQLSRFGAAVASPKHGAEVGERARSFQPGVAALERVDRPHGAATLPRSPPATTPAARSATPSARGAPNARASSKLLFCEAFRRFAIAEREMGERGLRSPGERSSGR